MPWQERFWNKVQKSIFPDACWLWTAAKDKMGYGKYRQTLAHRISYSLIKGKIKRGLVIDHLCRNKSCVNPGHLEAVTQKLNLERSIAVLSTLNKNKTHCPKGHAYSGANLKLTKTGRHCRVCQKHNLKKWYKKHKQRKSL